jgi:hypothetical protein
MTVERRPRMGVRRIATTRSGWRRRHGAGQRGHAGSRSAQGHGCAHCVGNRCRSDNGCRSRLWSSASEREKLKRDAGWFIGRRECHCADRCHQEPLLACGAILTGRLRPPAFNTICKPRQNLTAFSKASATTADKKAVISPHTDKRHEHENATSRIRGREGSPRKTSQAPKDAIGILVADHRTVQGLFDTFKKAEDDNLEKPTPCRRSASTVLNGRFVGPGTPQSVLSVIQHKAALGVGLSVGGDTRNAV